MSKCQVCGDEAIWAMQFIADDDPIFSRLGYHYRGFMVFKVCDKCKDDIQSKGQVYAWIVVQDVLGE